MEIEWENGKRIDEGVKGVNLNLSEETGQNEAELVCFEVKEIDQRSTGETVPLPSHAER